MYLLQWCNCSDLCYKKLFLYQSSLEVTCFLIIKIYLSNYIVFKVFFNINKSIIFILKIFSEGIQYEMIILINTDLLYNIIVN